jgi:hypothetical protein
MPLRRQEQVDDEHHQIQSSPRLSAERGVQMERTKIFVSYSHVDRAWAERLILHLAVLTRRKLIDVWSDRRIRIGSDWQAEINGALKSAKIALLLVTPGFLASKFIWEREMRLILAHVADGMKAYPLIARPCAWQLEPALAGLQARPADDRALSQGSESDIDFDLSRFVYEVARELEVDESEERQIDSVSARPPAVFSIPDGVAVEVWNGTYLSDEHIRLRIVARTGLSFQGRLEYVGTGTVTVVTGETVEDWNPSELPWSQIAQPRQPRQAQIALTFRESDYETIGSRKIVFDGSYHMIEIGDQLIGAWFSNGKNVGRVEFRRRQPRRDLIKR